MKLSLTRKQVQQCKELLDEYEGADNIEFSFSSESGIGTNIYATVKYTACHEYTMDITDYENW